MYYLYINMFTSLICRHVYTIHVNVLLCMGIQFSYKDLYALYD